MLERLPHNMATNRPFPTARHPTQCRDPKHRGCYKIARYITVEYACGWELAHVECVDCGVYFVGNEGNEHLKWWSPKGVTYGAEIGDQADHNGHIGGCPKCGWMKCEQECNHPQCIECAAVGENPIGIPPCECIADYKAALDEQRGRSE